MEIFALYLSGVLTKASRITEYAARRVEYKLKQFSIKNSNSFFTLYLSFYFPENSTETKFYAWKILFIDINKVLEFLEKDTLFISCQ